MFCLSVITETLTRHGLRSSNFWYFLGSHGEFNVCFRSNQPGVIQGASQCVVCAPCLKFLCRVENMVHRPHGCGLSGGTRGLGGAVEKCQTGLAHSVFPCEGRQASLEKINWCKSKLNCSSTEKNNLANLCLSIRKITMCQAANFFDGFACGLPTFFPQRQCSKQCGVNIFASNCLL